VIQVTPLARGRRVPAAAGRPPLGGAREAIVAQ
jgi:hypothetical protein